MYINVYALWKTMNRTFYIVKTFSMFLYFLIRVIYLNWFQVNEYRFSRLKVLKKISGNSCIIKKMNGNVCFFERIWISIFSMLMSMTVTASASFIVMPIVTLLLSWISMKRITGRIMCKNSASISHLSNVFVVCIQQRKCT